MNDGKLKKGIEFAKHYLVDCTGLLVASSPLYSFMETFISGMNSGTSIEARLKVLAVSYGGLGILYAKGRDLSRKFFGIKEGTSEKKQALHDSLYGLAFNIPASIGIYLSSGADLEETIIGTLGASALGFLYSPINGYALDTFRDFVGTVKTPRKMPFSLNDLGQRTKKYLALGLIATSIAATSEVYELKDTYFSDCSAKEIVHEYKDSLLDKLDVLDE